MTEYQDIQNGALGLLYETTSLLNMLKVKYVIVGGWTPYLLNSKPIHHPGTKDVDVLFDEGYKKGALKEVITEFLNNGFLLSAKHDFQLFKEMKVCGQKIIYNVDLLHPLETIKPNDIYVEHIDLGIPADKYQSQTFKMKSIALPSSQSLFDNQIISTYDLVLKTNDGKYLNQQIPLMGELGTLITKSKSVLVEKRYRDSLDIYLTIKQSQNLKLLLSKIKDLKKVNNNTYNVLYGIKDAFEKNLLFDNTNKYIKDLKEEEFIHDIKSFFDLAGLDNMAIS